MTLMGPQSQMTRNELSSLLGLSWLEVLLGGLAIVALFIRAGLSTLFTAYGVNQKVHDISESLRKSAGSFANLQIIRSSTATLLWALVGLVIVSLLWAMVVVIVDARNDLVISESFLHPHSFHKSHFWLAAMARRLIAAVLYASLAVYIFLLLRSTPIVYKSLHDLFSNNYGGFGHTAPTALLAIFIWLAGWHLTAVIRRLGKDLNEEISKVT